MINPKALEAMAEAMWQAESIRARGVGRKIPWGEVAEKTKDQWIDIAQAALTAYHKHLAEAGLVIVPAEVVALLKRYRNETPAGHSPHMVCQEVDLVLEKV
jgi:hypothetical protein